MQSNASDKRKRDGDAAVADGSKASVSSRLGPQGGGASVSNSAGVGAKDSSKSRQQDLDKEGKRARGSEHGASSRKDGAVRNSRSPVVAERRDSSQDGKGGGRGGRGSKDKRPFRNDQRR